MLDRLAQLARGAMLRTERTLLRRLWRLLYEILIRATAAYLRRDQPSAAVYVRRSLGLGEPVVGLSDIDLCVLLPEDASGPGIAREQVRQRWRHGRERLGLVGQAIEVGVYEDADLEQAVDGAPAHLYGLKGARLERGGRSLYLGDRPLADYYGLTIRPGLYGPTVDWRLVAGPERRPGRPRAGADYQRLAGWLELQYWWRNVCDACSEPGRADSAHLCFKAVAESARVWLWLAHGERIAWSRQAIERMTQLVPEEGPALEEFLDLRRALSRSPRSPLRETLETVRGILSRVVRVLDEQARAKGHTPVRLINTTELILRGPIRDAQRLLLSHVQALVPLCDWRALVCGSPRDEVLAIVPGDPTDPRVLTAASALDGGSAHPAFATEHLLLLAGREPGRSWFRAVQCPVTDPVSFALLEGDESASFPRLAGLSAADTAQRAVAEHSARLRHHLQNPGTGARDVAMLFTAARAALFQSTLDEGDAMLPVTVEATATLLAERRPHARVAAEEALAHYRDPDPASIRALAHQVRLLPPYAGATAGSHAAKAANRDPNLSAMCAQS